MSTPRLDSDRLWHTTRIDLIEAVSLHDTLNYALHSEPRRIPKHEVYRQTSKYTDTAL